MIFRAVESIGRKFEHSVWGCYLILIPLQGVKAHFISFSLFFAISSRSSNRI